MSHQKELFRLPFQQFGGLLNLSKQARQEQSPESEAACDDFMYGHHTYHLDLHGRSYWHPINYVFDQCYGLDLLRGNHRIHSDYGFDYFTPDEVKGLASDLECLTDDDIWLGLYDHWSDDDWSDDDWSDEERDGWVAICNAVKHFYLEAAVGGDAVITWANY